MKKILILITVTIVAIGCQFNETMVMNDDGTGVISVEANLSEMMAFGGSTFIDSSTIKMDTIIRMKQFLEEKKDSISKLSMNEQRKLKKLENFNFHMLMNSETSELVYKITTEFTDVNEANDIMNGLEQSSNLMPNKDAEDSKKDSPEVVGVAYSYKNGVFKRDAFIKDKKGHQQQVDSLKKTEMFMGGSNYTLNYTFPRKIKKTSNPQATFSEDKKTVILQKPFIEYFKNPDVLDLEVELED
ncbi:hypothetical protein [Aequorivita sp. Q41]|uniref:hypothetical protein n=1 Tax=Aequorivita sp. Q41 TaxID=3153300 RepID=UPI003242A9B0